MIGNNANTPLTAIRGAYYNEIDAVTTLSSNGEGSYTDFMGLFYVPSLLANETNACQNATQIPQDIFTKSNSTGALALSKIAFAPWGVPPDCQQALFRGARAVPYVAAYLTYLDDGSGDNPPPANDSRWDLGDGGQYQQNPWPIFAVNGQTGADILQLLSNYSQPSNTWVYTDIALQAASGLSVLPDLWTVVLAVLAAFIVVLAGVSGCLHLLQGRRRRDLRRRILAGQVNLEDIGLRKLTVPQEIMDKMPVVKYGSLAGQTSTAGSFDTVGEEKRNASARISTAATVAGSARTQHYNQPTCPICLDDFSADTDVRCLPCDHIFHPDCCDSFLRENSSLCPMCKKSVLPQGYCPEKVTNVMVRRERLARMRAEGRLEAGQQPLGAAARMRGYFGRRNNGRPTETSAVELAPAPRQTPQTIPPISSADLPPPAPVAGQSATAENCTPGRREWARRRALQLLGNSAPNPEDEDIDRAVRRPAWRRAIGKIFPSNGGST